jgi:uncharacterized protein (DUF1501 family)
LPFKTLNQTDGAINLDGFFGLHPSLKPLEKFWQSKQLAVIHSAGSPDNTRSHFDAQDYMESGRPASNRRATAGSTAFCKLHRKSDASPFRAVSMTGQLPRSLYRTRADVAMTNLAISPSKPAFIRNRAGRF